MIFSEKERAEAMEAARRRIAEVSMPRGRRCMVMVHEGGAELELWAAVLVRSYRNDEAYGSELLGPVERIPTFILTPLELHRGYRQGDAGPYLVLGVDG